MAPETYRYRTMLNYATMISPIERSPGAETAMLIRKRYYGKIHVHSTEILVRAFFGQLAPLVLMYLEVDAESASWTPRGQGANKLFWKTKDGTFDYTAPDTDIWDFVKG